MIKIIVMRKIIVKIGIIITIIRIVKMSIILMMIRVINEIIKKKNQINNLMIVKKEEKNLMIVKKEEKNQVKNENIIIPNHLMKKYNKQTYLHENLVEQKPIQITIIKLTIIIVAKTKTHQNTKRSLKSQML